MEYLAEIHNANDYHVLSAYYGLSIVCVLIFKFP